MSIERDSLENGLRIAHLKTEAKVAHLALIINTGSRDEKSGQEGIAHFIEHTIFKGTKRRKAFQVLGRMDNVGGEVNAYTTKEETCIYASFLNKDLNRAMEWFSDIVKNSTFPEKEIEKEKEVIIDEINSYKDSPQEEIFDEIEEIVFNDNSLGKYILGTPEQVKNINRKKILKFILQNYCANELVLVSIGNFESKRLFSLCNKYFSDINSKSKNSIREYPSNYKAVDIYKKKAFYQAHSIIANQVEGNKSENKYKIALLINMLGGPGLNTRLNMGIREKYGFCYNLEANYSTYSDTGIISIYMGTDFNSIEKTKLLVLKELRKLREKKLGILQLERAKNQLIGQTAIYNDEAINKLTGVGKTILMNDGFLSENEFDTKIRSISSSELLEIANQIFKEDELSFLTYTKMN